MADWLPVDHSCLQNEARPQGSCRTNIRHPALQMEREEREKRHTHKHTTFSSVRLSDKAVDSYVSDVFFCCVHVCVSL